MEAATRGSRTGIGLRCRLIPTALWVRDRRAIGGPAFRPLRGSKVVFETSHGLRHGPRCSRGALDRGAVEARAVGSVRTR